MGRTERRGRGGVDGKRGSWEIGGRGKRKRGETENGVGRGGVEGKG